MSKVTALVSAYYCFPYLEERLNNLLEEHAQPVVVCQSGSVDEEIARRYPEARLICTPDVPSLGAAWNLAIKASSGDYLTTANCDDLFYPGGCDEMQQVLDEHPEIGLVFSDVDRMTRGRINRWKRVDFVEGTVTEIGEVLRTRSIIGPMPMWRKSLHETAGYFDEGLVVSSDYEMWRRIVKAGAGVWYIPRSLGVYRDRDDSLEHRNRAVMRSEMEKLRR
jgi:glycosyltransferase involved in cell wall biosynthesis